MSIFSETHICKRLFIKSLESAFFKRKNLSEKNLPVAFESISPEKTVKLLSKVKDLIIPGPPGAPAPVTKTFILPSVRPQNFQHNLLLFEPPLILPERK